MGFKKIRNTSIAVTALSTVIAAMLLPIWTTCPASNPGKQLFSVVGGDYISPLIVSPRALQALNSRMGDYCRIAGYDQLQGMPYWRGKRESGSDFEIANVTRYSGDLLSMLGAKFVVDGRSDIQTRRIYLAEEFWKANFNPGAPIIGQGIQLGGEQYEVAGVIRTDDSAIGETDIWVPICSRGPYGTMTALRVIGELNPGQDWRAGEKELASLMGIETIQEQVVELDTVRLLPIERRIYFYAAGPERKIARLSEELPRREYKPLNRLRSPRVPG
jgi:hypothetical protein